MQFRMYRKTASNGRSSTGDRPFLGLLYSPWYHGRHAVVEVGFMLNAGRGIAEFDGSVGVDEFLEWVGEDVVLKSGASNAALIALARRCMDELAKRSAPDFDAEDYKRREANAFYGIPEDEPEDDEVV